MSCGVSPEVRCEAFEGASGAAWTVVTVLLELFNPPNAAINATTTPPPMRAERKGMKNVRFI
jgi:hypothetical protein